MRGQPDAATRRRRGAAYTPAEESLVARLEALSSEVAVHPDEDFRAETRQRLVAMAAVRTPATGATRRPPVRVGRLRALLTGAPDALPGRWRTRLTAGLAGAALTVTAVGGLLGAAQGAGPGDLLYDVKRGGEQTQLALAGDSRRGLTLLGFATTRLDELGDLTDPGVDLVLRTLATMDEQTTAGTAALTARAVREVDRGSLEVLSGWAADQRAGIGELSDAVPAGAQGALEESGTLVDAVAARSSALAEALGCAGGASTAGADELGPVPAACPPAAPTTGGGSTSGGSPSGGSTAASAASTAPEGTTAGSAAPTTGGAPTSGGPAPGTAAPPPGTTPGGAAGTTAPPAGSTSAGRQVPSPPVPSGGPPSQGLPSLPVPSLPVPSLPVPSLSLPSVPGGPPASPGPPGPVVSLPPVVPGVAVCLPPLITVGC